MEKIRGFNKTITKEEVSRDKTVKELKNITAESLAEKIITNLKEDGILPIALFDKAIASTIEYIVKNMDGLRIGNETEAYRDWAAACFALEDKLDKYAKIGTIGVYMIEALTPLKVRLDNGERTPELFNEIIEAIR